MPGLFGIVRVDPQRILYCEDLAAGLNRMAARLRHQDGYLTETHIDAGAGLALGRIGFPHHHPVAWPRDEDAKTRSIRCFIAGRPHYAEAAASWPASLDWGQHQSRMAAASGSYSAVLCAAAGHEPIILADRQASQPVFYAQCEGLLIFAPEVKALLEFSALDRSLDWAALATFLASGYLLAEQTFFTAIRRLPGGAQLAVADGTLAVRQYWRFTPGEYEVARPLDDYADEVGRRIDAAVAHDLDDPAHTVLLLSGGVDSRAILGAAYHALRRDGSRIHAVTWGCAPGRDGADIQIARQMGRVLSLDHRTLEVNMAAYADYGRVFRRVNFLLDGMSAAAAAHPDNYAITENLYASGVRVLLRGEQTFGFALREYSTQGSLAKLGLRRFREAPLLARVVKPEAYDALAEASDRVMDALIEESSALDPNDFTHRAYFRDRYQRLSGPAAYYKQVYMDHRSPLMDNDILDLIERLPKAYRDDKALLYHTIRKRYPEVSGFDYAWRTNLEDWAALIAADTPVRRYALEECADTSSGIWRYLDREAVRDIVTRAAPSRPAPAHDSVFGSALRRRLKSMLYTGAPRLAARIRLTQQTREGIPPHNVLMRSLILKNWYDTFVQY